MAQIAVKNLTFYYDGSDDNIFEDVSFSLDTNWKLGFIGRNGKGKTTFLKLLQGTMEYKGIISNSTQVDYFPYEMEEVDKSLNSIDILEILCPEYELWKVQREMNLLNMDSEVLFRSFQTLSNGEQTKLLLSLLFSQENHFLLIDEPTNHLDSKARSLVKEYLKMKKGFVLVSHDKDFMDECIDHVLVLNKKNITIEQGNFSSWWENKRRQDEYEMSRNETLKKDIKRLEESVKRSAMWADIAERSKIGSHKVVTVEPSIDARAYLGEKSRRMQQRRKNLELRREKEISEKESLLQNIEKAEDLKLFPQKYHKEILITLKDVEIKYNANPILTGFNLQIKNGERVALLGSNGCGKSSIIKRILGQDIPSTGLIEVPTGLKISYVNQDTSMLSGSLVDYTHQYGIDDTLFRAVLRKLDFERKQFDKPMENYSEGQKKKVFIARSLCEKAHLYIWDEPLNFIDIFSRMQIENLIKTFGPTLLFVEHDASFVEEIATKKIVIKR